MKAIRFIKSSAPYNAGEVAGFPPAIADGLIATGVAEVVTKDKPIETPQTENPALKESAPQQTKELKPQKTKAGK